MKISFSKYHGTGNDFVLIDDREHSLELSQGQIVFLCHRRFGIGADGLILLRNKEGFDFEMRYFNSDGKPGSMCGNGGRCITAFAAALGLVNEFTNFLAADGPHEATLLSQAPPLVKLKMGDVFRMEQHPDFFFLDTGSPHVVRFVEDVDVIDVVKEGREIRYNSRFLTEGTNVNFVQVANGGIRVRTYERGVEDETLSCGTGVTASALAAVEAGFVPVSANCCLVETPGGHLKVHYEKSESGFRNVFLEGTATFVYSGEISL